jgi:hypothetical protein
MGESLRKSFMLGACALLLIVLSTACPASASSSKTTEIDVRADSSSFWVVEERFTTDTSDNEIALRISQFENLIRATVENVKVITNRSMEIQNFTASGPVQLQDSKKVRYEFEWTNFAKTETGRLRIGDVFEAGFLDLPTAADVLTIQYPGDYAASSVTPSPSGTSGNTITWSGQKSFGYGEPSMTLTPIPSIWPKILLGVLIACGIVAGWFIWFKKLFRPMAKAAEKPKKAPESEEILKSDVDKALGILKAAGGKMYQTELVKRMDLSKSKVSALLSSMEEEGTIKRLRTGRKNLVSLATSAEEPVGES